MQKLFLILLFFKFYTSKSQSFVKPLISPTVSLGYCFSTKGLSFGLECDIKFIKSKHVSKEFLSGISLSNTWTKVKTNQRPSTHRHTVFNMVSETKLGYLKVGYGIVKNPWGYGKVNLCRINGLNLELGYNLTKQNTTYLGFRSFFYNKSNWRWLDIPYYTLYAKYKRDIKI